jgi:transposase
MNYFTGCDAHKKYSVFTSIDEKCKIQFTQRVEHDKEGFRSFLRSFPADTPVAVESTGNWYWIIDEIERAGLIPQLVHAARAKVMMGQINKTDKLDAEGLAKLLRNGTLPTVWIPPAEIRDQRELPRTRLSLVHMRTMLKNRIHATFAKYNITFPGLSDLFGITGRKRMEDALAELPEQTRRSVEQELHLLDEISRQILHSEQCIARVVEVTPSMKLLMTIPGIGKILATTIVLETGDITRFPDGEHFASYAGTVPRVSSSGGKTYFGRVRPDVNRYLKTAFAEAANVICLQQNKLAKRHVGSLYLRMREKKGHAKAIMAVSRHMAEATYNMLSKNEPYSEKKTQFAKPG